MGAVQSHTFFSIQGDNTVDIKNSRTINLLGNSGQLDDNNDVLNNIFRYIFGKKKEKYIKLGTLNRLFSTLPLLIY